MLPTQPCQSLSFVMFSHLPARLWAAREIANLRRIAVIHYRCQTSVSLKSRFLRSLKPQKWLQELRFITHSGWTRDVFKRLYACGGKNAMPAVLACIIYHIIFPMLDTEYATCQFCIYDQRRLGYRRKMSFVKQASVFLCLCSWWWQFNLSKCCLLCFGEKWFVSGFLWIIQRSFACFDLLVSQAQHSSTPGGGNGVFQTRFVWKLI